MSSYCMLSTMSFDGVVLYTCCMYMCVLCFSYVLHIRSLVTVNGLLHACFCFQDLTAAHCETSMTFSSTSVTRSAFSVPKSKHPHSPSLHNPPNRRSCDISGAAGDCPLDENENQVCFFTESYTEHPACWITVATWYAGLTEHSVCWINLCTYVDLIWALSVLG